jgi:hypothetical protein
MKKERANFKKEFKLYLACAEEDSFRPAFEYVHFFNDCAYASDAHILVKVPLEACVVGMDLEEVKKLNGFSVQWRALKKIYGLDRIYIERDDEAGTCALHSYIADHDITIWLKSQATMKMPGFDAVLTERESAEPTTKIGINPKFLYRLSQAINLNVVGMNVTSKRGKIFIEDSDNGAISVIMPVLVSEE